MNNAPNEKVNAQILKMRYSHESSPIKTSTANSSKNLRNETAIKVKEVRRASSAAKTRTQHTTNSDCYSGDMIRIENQSFTRYKYDPNRRDKNNEDFLSTKTIKYQQRGSPAKPHIETLRTANKSHDIHSRRDKIELLMRSSELTQQKQGSKLTNSSPKATEAQTSNSPARSPKENHMEAFPRKGFEVYHTGSHDKSCDLLFSGHKGIHQESATCIPADFDFVSFLSKDFQEKKNQFIMELARRKMQSSATLQKVSPSQNKITDMSNFLRTQETPSSTKNKMKGNETENKTETLDTDYSEHAKHGNHQQSEKLRKEFYTLDDSQSNCSPMMRYSTDCEPSCNSFGELKLLKNQRLSPEEKISRGSPSQQNSVTNELSNLMDIQFSWLMDKIIVLTQEKEALQWRTNEQNERIRKLEGMLFSLESKFNAHLAECESEKLQNREMQQHYSSQLNEIETEIKKRTIRSVSPQESVPQNIPEGKKVEKEFQQQVYNFKATLSRFQGRKSLLSQPNK